MQVSPGASVTIGGNVFTIADLKPLISSATVYVLLQLHRPGDVDHGKYWDTNAGGSWQASGSVVAWPTATYSHGSWWTYDTPVLASAKEGGTLKLVDLTDNLTPASQTTIAGGLESAEVSPVSREFIADLVESQRPAHTWQQNESFYVDPYNGSDTTGNGTRGQPYATVTQALNATSDSRHTVIFLVAGDPTGTTYLDEQFTINKRYTSIRGPGRDFIIQPSVTGDVITITAAGASLEKARVLSHTVGVGRAIVINQADFCLLSHVWVDATRGHGVAVLGANFAQIHDCWLHEVGQSGAGHGIVLDPTTADVAHTHIEHCHVFDVQGDGIRLESGGTLHDTVVHACEVSGATGWGINIVAGSNASVHHNVLLNNTSGGINDNGTLSSVENNEQWGTETAVASVQTDTTALIADVAAVQVTADSIETNLLLSGAFAVVIQVRDLLAAAVPGATVHILSSGGVEIGNTFDSDLDGDVTVYLDAGDYQVRIVSPQYDQTTKPQNFTVVGAMSVAVPGTSWAPPAPSDPAFCVVYGYLNDIIGTDAAGIVMTIEASTYSVAQGLVMTNTQQTATADVNGYVTLEVVRGASATVNITEAGWHNRALTVPEAASQDLATWTT